MATIGFIGVGNMGTPLVRAVCGQVEPAQVLACDHHPDRLARLADECGFSAVESAEEVAQDADYVVVGVKPQGVSALLEEMAPVLQRRQGAGTPPVLVSLAAGYPLGEFDRILSGLSLDVPVVRLMPNSGVGVGEGICLFARNEAVSDDALERLMTIFSGTGLCEAVDEDVLERAIPIFSCSPAYVYIFIESLADAGVQIGLERDLALRLATQAVYGTAANALQSDKHVAQLREELCTPRGMTIAATNAMERAGFRSAVIEGALAAWRRSKDMLD